MTDLLLTGIGRLVTNVGPVITGAAVAVDGGRITYAGAGADAPDQGGGTRIDCGGRAVVPGFVDAHTHVAFAGDRADEFAARLGGADYETIAAMGGGIVSTVAATRASTAQGLFEETASRAWRMIESGTTAIEIKSGYGLDVATEVKLLEVARRIGDELPLTVKTTFLGAHALPPEYRGDRAGYVDLIVEEMLPAVAPLADYCDVFVEESAFSADEGRRIFEAAAEYGLGARVHAEQLRPGEGAALAAEIGAVSADHLDHVTPEGAAALAVAGVSAVLTPGASYSLRSSQAPGPMLLDHGVNLAVATDCNPGTSYVESMGLVISLACVQMGLGVEEAVFAATRGGALSLGLEDHGIVSQGAVADLVVLDAPSESHLAYRPATNLVWQTIKGGMQIDPRS